MAFLHLDSFDKEYSVINTHLNEKDQYFENARDEQVFLLLPSLSFLLKKKTN